MGKKILVTGGTGFIGRTLLKYILEDDSIESVDVVDNLSNSKFLHELGYYLHPINHTNTFENGTDINFLQQLYNIEDYGNVFILIGDIDMTRGILLLDGRDYGKLTIEEFDTYNNLMYLNRVGVSCQRKTLFWVIPQ